MTQNTIPDLSTELKPAMENLRTSLHTLMKSAGTSFTLNSTIDSLQVKGAPEPSTPSFERSLEDFSQNCDTLLYELKQRRQALVLAQYSMTMPCDPKTSYNQYKSVAKTHHTRVEELHGILGKLKSELAEKDDNVHQGIGSEIDMLALGT